MTAHFGEGGVQLGAAKFARDHKYGEKLFVCKILYKDNLYSADNIYIFLGFYFLNPFLSSEYEVTGTHCVLRTSECSWKVWLFTLSRDWRTSTRWPEAITISVQCVAGAKMDMPASSSFCWHALTFPDEKDFFKCKIYVYSDICWHLLTFADICWHLLTFADICWYLLTFAEPCRLKRCNNFPKTL
jgi:hypothetical protein